LSDNSVNGPLEIVRSFELNVTPGGQNPEKEGGPMAQDLLVSTVPEPGSLSLLGLGLLGLMWGVKVQRKREFSKGDDSL
jgi:hypothetical protein